MILAVLHDVIEDTDVTLEEIREAYKGTFYEHLVISDLDAVTHKNNQPYREYVIGISKSIISKIVKIFDLEDNIDPSRMVMRFGQEEEKQDARRIVKHRRAWMFLKGKITTDQFMNSN